MKRIYILLVLILAAFMLLAGCADNRDSEAVQNYSDGRDLNGVRLGVELGSNEIEAAKELLPDSELYYYTEFFDMLPALKAKKIDAFIGSEAPVTYLLKEDSFAAAVPVEGYEA